MIGPLAQFGLYVQERLARTGVFTQFVLATLRALLTSTKSWSRWSRFGPQLYSIGTKSVPVLAITGAFIGAILAIEGYGQFRSIGQEQRLGGAISVSIVKQIGPVLAAVMLAGRVGCSLTAELGSMNVTEQLNAMRVMAADPIRVLVAPRVAACVVMIPILTIASNICGIAGGWVIGVPVYGINNDRYWEYTASFADYRDITDGLIKSLFFGAAIGLISCYKGFHCRPGAQGVGRATTEAFVTSFVAIILLNLVLAKFLNDLHMAGEGFTPFFS